MINRDDIIIIDEYIQVSIFSRNKKYYMNKGYDCNLGDVITIPIKDLSPKSRIKINVKCPCCNKLREIEYRQIFKSGHTYCNSCASSITHKKDYKCEYCENKATRIFDNKHCCDKHYGQLNKYGTTLERTCRDSNEIKKHDLYIEVFTYSKLGDIDNSFFIDINDYEKIKEYKWTTDKINNCIVGQVSNKQAKLHRFLFEDIKQNEYILFKDNNKNNCRRSNLIVSTHKFLDKEIKPISEDDVQIIENIKFEKIDKKTLRLLNIRHYHKSFGNMKDIIVQINENGCWNCISHSQYRGGYIHLYKNDKKIKLHREVLSIKLGRELKPDEMTRHICDNPQCCNPNHLIVGTALDNYNDMIRRGRAYFQTNPPKTKKIIKRKIHDKDVITTEEDVKLIYSKVISENMSQKNVCINYGYTRGVVNNIINKITWKHITDEMDKTLQDKRKLDDIEKVSTIKYLLKGDLYTIREIEFLTGYNRETVRKIKNNLIYQDICTDIKIDDEPIIYTMGITYSSLVDGVGIRDSCYCSFCKHNCLNCHNPQTHIIKNGQPIKISELFNLLSKNPLTNITFTGGDPMYQHKGFELLGKMIKEKTSKNIWIYSGFTYEEIIKDKNKLNLLKYCDVLVDGRFEIEKRDITLAFKGSSNQRIIDVQKSLKQNKLILYME